MIDPADEPAFPVEVAFSGDVLRGQQTGSYSGWATGLTTRELFAAMAMQGLCACQGAYEEWTVEQKSAVAVRQADALIAELNKPKEVQS
jgi:hypothetical protein